MEKETFLGYSVYWENIDRCNEIKYAMVFHTEDGKMILGVSLEGANPRSEAVIKSFEDISLFLGSKEGCVTIEEMPPTNSIDFILFCNQRAK